MDTGVPVQGEAGPPAAPTISRRTLLASLGLAAVAVGVRPLRSSAYAATSLSSSALTTPLQLSMRHCLVEMVDETRVPMWAFDSPQTGPRVPGPVMEALEGGEIAIDVTNELDRPAAFAIPGVVDSGPIEPGATVAVRFTAPGAGTYVYLDPTNAPIHRAMGLAGVLVVLPAEETGTPYSHPTPPVRNLFDDLGTTARFPGDPWREERSWLWIFSSIDPALAVRVNADPGLSPETFVADYLPTYFTINGRSGYFAAKDPATAIHGRVGQPTLVRVVNVGLAYHMPHVHGNHVFVMSRDGVLTRNMPQLDTWQLPPLARTDILLPFIRPPDAYPWPPSDPNVWTTDLAGDGTRGMVYAVHCHTELSLLANGANYPQGAVTHWVLTGDLETPAQEEPGGGGPPGGEQPPGDISEPVPPPGGPGDNPPPSTGDPGGAPSAPLTPDGTTDGETLELGRRWRRPTRWSDDRALRRRRSGRSDG